jgi:hypothetical protein
VPAPLPPVPERKGCVRSASEAMADIGRHRVSRTALSLDFADGLSDCSLEPTVVGVLKKSP